jgi:UDP-N-acetylmuramoyl-tripeptide--D-alanyl-D-alanine ligase
MIALTLREIADAVSGTVHDADGELLVTAPFFVDSRKAIAGGLFVALPGKNADGHDYVDVAMAGGAVAVLAERPVGAPAVVVPDGVDALGRLSRLLIARRAAYPGPELTLIGITGSAGKTTTKDLISHLIGGLGGTVATPGNFNNEIGLPLTVSLIEPDTRFLVLEMGARHIGHIAYLCEIAAPSVGIVTNVGTAHLGEFGGVDAIAKGKGELVESLPAEGLAVLNADDFRVAGMRPRTKANVALYGLAPEADIRAEDVTLDERGRPRYTLHTPEGSAPVAMLMTGEHQVSNALAAAAVARHAGLSLEEIAAGLSSATPASRGRLEITDRPDGVTIVNDAYNANPNSTRAALKALHAMSGGRRTIAVLGAMMRLGDVAESEHRAIGALTAELGVDLLVTVDGELTGEEARWLAEGAEQVGTSVVRTADNAEARVLLEETLRSGDIVLLKASKPVGLQPLGEQLAGQSEAVGAAH